MKDIINKIKASNVLKKKFLRNYHKYNIGHEGSNLRPIAIEINSPYNRILCQSPDKKYGWNMFATNISFGDFIWIDGYILSPNDCAWYVILDEKIFNHLRKQKAADKTSNTEK